MQFYVDILPENMMHKHILLTNKLTSMQKKKKIFPPQSLSFIPDHTQ